MGRATLVRTDGEFGGQEDVLALFGIGSEPFCEELFGVSVFVRFIAYD
jgi:hypothetical protein